MRWTKKVDDPPSSEFPQGEAMTADSFDPVREYQGNNQQQQAAAGMQHRQESKDEKRPGGEEEGEEVARHSYALLCVSSRWYSLRRCASSRSASSASFMAWTRKM